MKQQLLTKPLGFRSLVGGVGFSNRLYTTKLHNLKSIFILAALLTFSSVTWADTDAKNWIGKLSSTSDFYSESNSNISSFTDFSAANGTVTLNLADGKSEFRIGMTLPSAFEMNNSDTYLVFEATNLSTSSSKAKLDNYTVGSTNYVYKDGNGCRFAKISLSSSVLYIVSLMGDNAPSGLLNVYASATNSKVSATNLRMIFDAASAGASVVVKRMGLYTLKEILDLYSGETAVSGLKWRLAYSNYPWIESDGTGAGLRVNNKAASAPDASVTKLVLSSLGNVSCNMDLRNMNWGTTPLTEDVLAQFTNTSKILLTTGDQIYVPTMNNEKVYLAGADYYPYKDGSLSVSKKHDGTTAYTGYSYTRNFVEGYSSCCLPFDVTTSELPSGLSAYTFSSCTAEGVVTFEPAGASIVAGTPFVIKANAAGYYIITAGYIKDATPTNVIASPTSYYATDASNNVNFVGSFVNEVPTGAYTSTVNYGIKSDGSGFAKMKNDTKTTYYRAFIADNRSPGARGLSLGFENGDGTTDIINIEDVHGMEIVGNDAVYNLQGVQMNAENLPKGIYIKNGKKFIVK